MTNPFDIFAQIAVPRQTQEVDPATGLNVSRAQILEALMAEARKKKEAEKQAQLAQLTSEMSPLLGLLKAKSQVGPSAADMNPSKMDLFFEAMQNMGHFYDPKYTKAADRRIQRTELAQKNQNEALNQLRLMLDTKSRAEDRISDNSAKDLQNLFTQEQNKLRMEFLEEKEREARDYRREQLGLSRDRMEISQRNSYLQGLRTMSNFSVQARLQALREGLTEGTPQYLQRFTELTKQFREGSRLDPMGVIKQETPGGQTVVTPYRIPAGTPVDTKRNSSPPNPVPAMRAIPAGASPGQKNVSVAQVPVQETSTGSSIWRAPNGAGLSHIPNIKYDPNAVSFIGRKKASEYLDTTKELRETYAKALTVFNKMASDPKKRNLLDTTSFVNLSENAAALVGAITPDKWFGEYQPGAGAANAKRFQEIFGYPIDPDQASLIMLMAKLGNDVIHAQTGAAGSLPEFLRISLETPALGEAPETLAKKAFFNLLANSHNLLNLGVFTENGATVKDQIQSADASHFINELSTELGSLSSKGLLRSSQIEKLLQPEALAQAEVAYVQALKNSGPEAAEDVITGLIQALRAQGMSNANKSKDIKKQMQDEAWLQEQLRQRGIK